MRIGENRRRQIDRIVWRRWYRERIERRQSIRKSMENQRDAKGNTDKESQKGQIEQMNKERQSGIKTKGQEIDNESDDRVKDKNYDESKLEETERQQEMNVENEMERVCRNKGRAWRDSEEDRDEDRDRVREKDREKENKRERGQREKNETTQQHKRYFTYFVSSI